VHQGDVRFGLRTAAGTRAWDVGLTLVATARKLGVNIYHYIQDRLAGRNELPALADLILIWRPNGTNSTNHEDHEGPRTAGSWV
jgi:hypothetical protein